MGFVTDKFGDGLVVRELIIVLIQGCDGEAQRLKDSREMVKPTALQRGSLSAPLAVGQPLNEEIVGKKGAEYRHVGTAARKDEARTATLLKDGLELGGRDASSTSMRRKKHSKKRPADLFQNEELSGGIRSLNRRVPPFSTERTLVLDTEEGNVGSADPFEHQAIHSERNSRWRLSHISTH
jgi:hypothetical protein